MTKRKDARKTLKIKSDVHKKLKLLSVEMEVSLGECIDILVDEKFKDMKQK